MDDWKKRVDEALEAKRRVEQERQAEIRRRQEEKEKRHLEKLKSEYKERLRKHQQRFRCHICGKPSQGPRRLVYWYGPGMGYIDYEEKGNRTGHFTEGMVFSEEDVWELDEPYGDRPDWNRPFGLYKCHKCSRWTCGDHFHLDRCQYCWEGKTGPSLLGLLRRLR